MSMFCGFSLGELINRGLKVGEHFNMQPDCYIDYSHCWLIEIGNNVIFAPRVHVLAHDASMLNHTGHTLIGRVKIGNNVFVGDGAIILPGTTIGDNVIIGSGSVVTKDVPSDVIVAGNPAKVISSMEEHANKAKERLSNSPVFDLSYTLEGGITPQMKEEMKEKLSKGYGFIKSF